MKPEEQDPLNPRRHEPGYDNEPYFVAMPSIPSSPQDLLLKLPDMTITLKADRGVFSYTHVDRGTLVLLREDLPPERPGALLDLGCGYGLVAITLALRYPDRQIWGIDVNERAVDLLNENAARLNLANVKGVTPEQAKGNTFAAIYSNPPVRVGKQAMRELLVEWLQRLHEDGQAYWVVKKNLGADSLADYLTARGYPTTRLRAKQGYRVLLSRPLLL